MSTYLFPPAIEANEITDVARKAGIEFNQFGKLRDLILAEKAAPIVLGSITAQDLLVLNRHAKTIVDEVPTIVMSAPGFLYSGDWVGVASALPAVDWKELLGKLSKSGHLATDPDSLAKRDLGAVHYEAPAGLERSAGRGHAMTKQRPKGDSPTGSDPTPYDPDEEVD